MHKDLLVPFKSLCFPQSRGSSAIKSHCPSKSDFLGIPVPLRDPQIGKSDGGLELLQQCKSFFGIVLQLMGCPLSGYGI